MAMLSLWTHEATYTPYITVTGHYITTCKASFVDIYNQDFPHDTAYMLIYSRVDMFTGTISAMPDKPSRRPVTGRCSMTSEVTTASSADIYSLNRDVDMFTGTNISAMPDKPSRRPVTGRCSMTSEVTRASSADIYNLSQDFPHDTAYMLSDCIELSLVRTA